MLSRAGLLSSAIPKHRRCARIVKSAAIPTQDHNLAASTFLLTPSLNTYPAATGVTQLPPPGATPFGAFFNLSVKKTGCRMEGSNGTCGRIGNGSGRFEGLGGIASI